MASQLDGAGTAKMETLDRALAEVQRLHGLVERMAVAVKTHQDTSTFGPQIKRAGAPLVGLLKPQFGMISDQVAALTLVATRGGGEQSKVRALREAVAQLRVQLELAANKVREKHATDAPSRGESA